MRLPFVFLVLAGVLTLIAPSCPTTVIKYHQVGACNGGSTDDGEYNAGPNQAYVVFAIEEIDNSQNPNAFAYDPSNIYVTGNPNQAFDSNLSIYQYLLGPFATAPLTVNAQAAIGFNPYGYG